MRTKVTLVLLFLNVALFFFIFEFERGWRTDRASREARVRVLGAEAANIQSLEISRAGGAAPVSLVKRGNAWFLTRPFAWPANPLAVGRILTDLHLLDHVTSFSVADLLKNGQKLSDYGLDPPTLTVTFSSLDPSAPRAAAPPVSLRLGSRTPDGNLLYLLSPDGETVHIVQRSLADSLAQTADQLRADTLFSIPVFEAHFFSLSPVASPALLLRRDGSQWSFEAPVKARASKLDTELTITALDALRVKSFVAAPPADAALANPVLRVSIEGNNRSETLLLYGPVGGAALPAPNAAPADTEYYARMEDRKDTLFTVVLPGPLKARLDNAAVALRERRLLDFDTGAVTALTLDAPEAAELSLQRLESIATATSLASWQIVRRDAAGQNPQTQRADTGVIQHLLDQLAQLKAREFLSDEPSRSDLETWGFNRPERTVVLTLLGLANAPPATLRLELGLNADRRQAYARVAGADSVYEVDPEILREIPVTPLSYRDRLLRELPPGAQITGLRLTDLATKAVLADLTFTPGTSPAPAALRTLRAQEFVSDHFTPAPSVDGVPRPWKYQLDLAISLVGGPAAAPPETVRLMLGERLGGTTQLAGSPEFDAVWTLEQPYLDALWSLVYGPRDPGPTPPKP